jgi:hypothetical protein
VERQRSRELDPLNLTAGTGSVKVDDRLASLQSDPRFADLCERIHP